MDNLKTKIKKCGITQKKLAKQINITQGLVSLWCSNVRKPSIFQVQKLAKLLNISTDEAIDLFKQDIDSDNPKAC